MELTVPGVYIEEVETRVAVATPVSAAVAGFVGFTPRGPTDATFFTSFSEFVARYGPIDGRSHIGHSVAAYFANGGQRAYMRRVLPSDAVAAECNLRNDVTQQQIETGSGTTGYSKTAGTTPLHVNGGDAVVQDGSLTLTWRGSGTPITAERLYDRAGSASVLANGSASYEGQFRPASISSLVSPRFDCIVPGSVTFSWDPAGSGASTYALTAAPTNGVSTGVNGAGSTFTVDYRTGKWSIRFVGADIPASGVVTTSLTVDYTPTTSTYTATETGGVISGSGIASGSITHATGAYSITTTSGATPYTRSPIYASYSVVGADPAVAKTAGAWGGALDADGVLRGLSLSVSGDPAAYVTATGTYSQWLLNVSLYNTATGRDEVAESYDGLVFDDPTSRRWWVDVVNDLSDLVVVGSAVSNEPPQQLQGRAYVRSLVGGDGGSSGRTVTVTLPAGSGRPLPRTVVITYTDTGGTVRTITDDGAGGLTGSLDATYTTAYAGVPGNEISYRDGVLNFRTGAAIRGGTLVMLSYVAAPTASEVTAAFGDADLGYVAGEDGSFDSGHYGRDEFTNPELAATNGGIYGFDVGDSADEILTLVVPDFVGDAVVSGDLIDYAETRAARPAGGDRFVLLAPPSGYTSERAVDFRRNVIASHTKYAALYWPWVKVPDTAVPGRAIVTPPLGHIAGIFARAAARQNVSRAPAGVDFGALRYLTGLERVPNDADLQAAFRNGINALRDSRQTGRCVWGARTLASTDPFQFIQATRLFMFVERSIYLSTWWTVFENTGPALWTKVRLQVESFLEGLFRQGYFAGSSAAQAYSVVCDNTNNVEGSNQTVIDVAIAPTKPSEFVRFRFAPRQITSA